MERPIWERLQGNILESNSSFDLRRCVNTAAMSGLRGRHENYPFARPGTRRYPDCVTHFQLTIP